MPTSVDRSVLLIVESINLGLSELGQIIRLVTSEPIMTMSKDCKYSLTVINGRILGVVSITFTQRFIHL